MVMGFNVLLKGTLVKTKCVNVLLRGIGVKTDKEIRLDIGKKVNKKH